MFDSATVSLLKKDFGLTESHLVILNYLLENKRATAEQIYNSTKVPKGRAYEFLTELVDFGFVDVHYSRPKVYSMENVVRAFDQALKVKETSLIETEKKVHSVAASLRRRVGSAEPQFKIDFTSDDDYCYSKLCDMLLSTKEFRVSTMAPVLFLKEQQQSFQRRKYLKMLHDMTDAGQIELRYLVTLDILSKKIIEGHDTAAISALYDVLGHPHIDVRVPPSLPGGKIFTGSVSQNMVLITFYMDIMKSTQRNAIFINSAEFAAIFGEAFDAVFNTAEKLSEDHIKAIEAQM
jgi:sugar-specific transcriptional regulator TrmB